MQTPYEKALQFERDVADIYRILGARVKHDVALAGNQIDILIEEHTSSGTELRTAIECKSFSKPVGVDIVNSIAGLAVLLKSRNLVDQFVIVSASGFTRASRESAEAHGVILLEFEDLKQRITGLKVELTKAKDAEKEKSEAVSLLKDRTKHAFVVMPFTPEFNDVYILGIREVAEDLGIVVERADNIEHNQSIPEVIRERIRLCDVVIAETSEHNPNVFYEVGLAHGIEKETILICRNVEDIPFDLSAINHIIYAGIVELREKLSERLHKTLNL